MSPKVDGKSIPLWESIEIKKDATLEMSYATIGARSYIAFSGGIDSKPWLGSRSTFHKAGVGGIDGKALQDGQEIKINKAYLVSCVNSRVNDLTEAAKIVKNMEKLNFYFFSKKAS